MSDFTYTILENALDDLAHATECLGGDPSKRDLKHAARHLWTGLVLLLRERLRRKDWRLLFSKVDDADEEVLNTGDFHPVYFDELLKRLKADEVVIDDEELIEIERLRALRLRLEHSHIVGSSEEVKAVASRTLSIVLEFIADELDGMDPICARLLHAIREASAEFRKFVDDRMLEIADSLEKAYGLVTCPLCGQEAMRLGDGDPTCEFCRYTEDAEAVAGQFIARRLGIDEFRHVKKGGESPRRRCPECSGDMVVEGSSGDSTPNPQEAVCFSCGESWAEGELKACCDCNELFKPAGRGVFRCPECFSNLVNSEHT